MSGMRLAKIIRESKGLKPWQMHKVLGRKSVQSYLQFERSAKKVTLSELIKLYELSELSLDEFWRILISSIESDKKVKKGKEI